MSAWFHRPKYTIIRKAQGEQKDTKIPEGMWVKCDACSAIMLKKEQEENLNVCPRCGKHYRVTAKARIEMTVDPGTFEVKFEEIRPVDFMEFPQYKEKLASSAKKTGLTESVITGTGKINGIRTAIGVTDFFFMGGSLGSVTGERITAIIETAISEKIPLVLISASGGGMRMQEAIVSLMQMAKISAALSKLADAGLPYISVMTDPTGGGVTASFSMLGDVNVAEPGALIMFAGPRVIEQTIRQKLPEGFQRAEFLLEHGMVDMIVPRREMKDTISGLLDKLTSPNRYAAAKA